MKFLVVDDSQATRRIVTNTVRGLGYEDIIEAESEKDAITKSYVDKIDFTITDRNVPNMSGRDFTRAVRSDDQFVSPPI